MRSPSHSIRLKSICLVIQPVAHGHLPTDGSLRFPLPKTGNFVSPAMTASGEVRMCFKTDLDWWRTEFTLHDGEIFYRDFNLIDSWTEKGEGYSVQGSAGNVMYLNFTAGTGEKK